MWPFKNKPKLVTPGVWVQEVDKSTAKMAWPQPGGTADETVFGFSVHLDQPVEKDPTKRVFGLIENGGEELKQQEVVVIGPRTKRVRWWEFWRWHQYPRYRRECRKAMKEFSEVFGQPAQKSGVVRACYWDKDLKEHVEQAK